MGGCRSLVALFVFFISITFIACASEDVTETGGENVAPEQPTLPEQVSFANWEKPENCELGTMPVIGEAQCQPVGAECPAEDWPALVPAGEQIIYVQPGGTGDGTSKESPLGKVQHAVALAESGAVIVLSKGEFLDNLILEKSLTLVGTCPAETVLRGEVAMAESGTGPVVTADFHEPISQAGEPLAVITVQGEVTLDISQLTLTGDNLGMLVDGREKVDLNIHSVIFKDLIDTGFYTQGSNATINMGSVVVQGTRHRVDLDHGRGIRVYDAVFSMERGFVDKNYFGGFECAGSLLDTRANVSLENSILQNGISSPIGARAGGIQGYGVSVWQCDFVGKKLLLDNNDFYGLGVFSTSEIPAYVDLQDTIIHKTKSTPEFRNSDKFPWVDSEAGIGILVWGGEVYLDKILLEENHSTNLLVMESAYPCEINTLEACKSSYVVAENITSKSPLPDSIGVGGVGMVVMDGAEALVSKASFDKSNYIGVYVVDSMRRNGSGNTLALFTDVTVTNVKKGQTADASAEGELFGDGIVVAAGALASFNRFKVSSVERVGVLLNGRYDLTELEETFGKKGQVEKEAVERSKVDKNGKVDAVLSQGSIEKSKVGINNQMTDELGKKSKVDLSTSVTTSETEKEYSTDAIAVPSFSLLNKAFMEEVFGAGLDAQQE